MNHRSLGALALLIAAPAALLAWHNHLTKSAPLANESVSSPREIRLWFAEKVEPKFSSITLTRPDSSKVELGKVRATDDPSSIVADVPQPLAAGTYTVIWRTAGGDGHAVRGRFAFTVK